MKSIPIHYADVHIGMALVDDALEELSPNLTWRVEIPKPIRRQARGEKHVLVALLREDYTLLARCHPYVWVGSKIPLRLSRVALRPDLVPLLNRTANKNTDEETMDKIRELTKEVKHVVFLNGVRVDCQTENLKEVI